MAFSVAAGCPAVSGRAFRLSWRAVGRVQLFEFEDQPWFPRALRAAMTDFLGYMGNRFDHPYEHFAPKVQRGLAATRATRLVDLCSGAGGPAVALRRVLARNGTQVEVTLTDLYPNLSRFEHARMLSNGGVGFEAEPVNATGVPEKLSGFRTIFNGLHHFQPDEAARILGDAVRRREGIAVFEAVDRSPMALISTILSPVTILVVTPFIRPFSVTRLLFTYLVPLIPLFTLWDGVVSCLRVYSPDELRKLVDSLPANDYHWDIGRLPIVGTPAHVTYLVGHPPGPATN